MICLICRNPTTLKKSQPTAGDNGRICDACDKQIERTARPFLLKDVRAYHAAQDASEAAR